MEFFSACNNEKTGSGLGMIGSGDLCYMDVVAHTKR